MFLSDPLPKMESEYRTCKRTKDVEQSRQKFRKGLVTQWGSSVRKSLHFFEDGCVRVPSGSLELHAKAPNRRAPNCLILLKPSEDRV